MAGRLDQFRRGRRYFVSIFLFIGLTAREGGTEGGRRERQREREKNPRGDKREERGREGED